MTRWYDEAFSGAYLTLYQHRSDAQAAEEISWLLNELQTTSGQQVLDLCCGNGRHAAPLSQHQLKVVGLDRSNDLLAEAMARDEGQVNWVRGDMRSLPFGESFDLIVNLFTSFGYFDDPTDDKQVIDEMARVLRPGGHVVLDTLNAQKVQRDLVPESHTTRDGWVIHETRRLVENDQRVEKQVQLIDAQGEQTSWTESVRLYDQNSIERLTNDTGLTVNSVYGSMAGGEHTPESDRLVLVFEGASR